MRMRSPPPYANEPRSVGVGRHAASRSESYNRRRRRARSIRPSLRQFRRPSLDHAHPLEQRQRAFPVFGQFGSQVSSVAQSARAHLLDDQLCRACRAELARQPHRLGSRRSVRPAPPLRAPAPAAPGSSAAPADRSPVAIGSPRHPPDRAAAPPPRPSSGSPIATSRGSNSPRAARPHERVVHRALGARCSAPAPGPAPSASGSSARANRRISPAASASANSPMRRNRIAPGFAHLGPTLQGRGRDRACPRSQRMRRRALQPPALPAVPLPVPGRTSLIRQHRFGLGDRTGRAYVEPQPLMWHRPISTTRIRIRPVPEQVGREHGPCGQSAINRGDRI